MFRFLKNHTYPIGIDMGNDSLQVAQLRNNGRGIGLIAGGSENRPADVEMRKVLLKITDRLPI